MSASPRFRHRASSLFASRKPSNRSLPHQAIYCTSIYHISLNGVSFCSLSVSLKSFSFLFFFFALSLLSRQLEVDTTQRKLLFFFFCTSHCLFTLQYRHPATFGVDMRRLKRDMSAFPCMFVFQCAYWSNCTPLKGGKPSCYFTIIIIIFIFISVITVIIVFV